MITDFKYIDIHGHINFAAYDKDREAVIQRAKDASVAMIAVGTQHETSQKAVEIANRYENVYATVGLHPVHTSASHHDEQEFGDGKRDFTSKGENMDLGKYVELAKGPKVVAIGECGLDYYHCGDEEVKKQIPAFEQMIDLANEVDRPLMLHLRSGSNRSAYLDAYSILKERAKVKGDLHFFAGNVEEAKLFLELGYSFSFTGVLTFTHDYDEVVKHIPIDRIMSETDCPYVSPVPHRGKRNEPIYVNEVVKAIAKIKSMDEEKVAEQIGKNASRVFDIR